MANSIMVVCTPSRSLHDTHHNHVPSAPTLRASADRDTDLCHFALPAVDRSRLFHSSFVSPGKPPSNTVLLISSKNVCAYRSLRCCSAASSAFFVSRGAFAADPAFLGCEAGLALRTGALAWDSPSVSDSGSESVEWTETIRRTGVVGREAEGTARAG